MWFLLDVYFQCYSQIQITSISLNWPQTGNNHKPKMLCRLYNWKTLSCTHQSISGWKKMTCHNYNPRSIHSSKKKNKCRDAVLLRSYMLRETLPYFLLLRTNSANRHALFIPTFNPNSPSFITNLAASHSIWHATWLWSPKKWSRNFFTHPKKSAKKE